MNYYKIKYLKYKEKYLNFKQKYCVYNKSLDITIYHFYTENLINNNPFDESLQTQNVVIQKLTVPSIIKNPTTNKNIIYHKQNRFMSTDDFKKLIDPIIEACKINNVLIIIDSRFDPDPPVTEHKKDVYKLFNECFFNCQNLYENITLINLTDDNTKVLYLYKNSMGLEIFRKNVNIIPYDTTLSLNERNFFSNMEPDKNYIKEVDFSKEPGDFFVAFPTSQTGGTKHNVNFRKMNIKNTPPDSIKLVDQWWFKWYFSVPPCLSNRLMQATGTCWMNSIINSLFFVPKIEELLKNEYAKLDNKSIINNITLTQIGCTTCKYDLKTLLFSLVNNLLINKKKAQTSDENFIVNIASKVKCMYAYENEIDDTKCIGSRKDKHYGDGGDPYAGIKIILRNFFGVDSKLFYYYSYEEEQTKKYDEYIIKFKKFKEMEVMYNNQVDIFNASTKSQAEQDTIQKAKDNLKNSENEKKEPEEVMNKFRAYNENNGTSLQFAIKKELKQEWQKFLKDMIGEKNPQILILRYNEFFELGEPAKDIQVSLQCTYKLCSASISLDPNFAHAIAGIICDGRKYVYDSNNIIVETDWPNNDIKKYLDSGEFKKFYPRYPTNPILPLSNFHYLIYIRVTSGTGSSPAATRPHQQ